MPQPQISPEQLAWVEKSLAVLPQSAKMVVIGHLPYMQWQLDAMNQVRFFNADKLRLLLERYRVHTHISGHHHAYFQVIGAAAITYRSTWRWSSSIPTVACQPRRL